MPLSFQYSRWDGTQEVFPFGEDSLMDELSDQLLSHGDVTTALRNMMRRGLQGLEGQRKGLQDILEQLRSRRQQDLDRYNLSSALADVKQRLESIMRQEEEGIERQLDRARAQREQEHSGQDTGLDPETAQKLLDDLERRAIASRERISQVPRDNPAEAIQKLRDYEFTDPQAKQEFDDLLQMLQQKVAESLFKDLSQSLRNMSPEQMQDLKQMAQDLNRMLEQKLRGEEPDFQDLMREWGSMFGDNLPKDMDEFIEQMQQRMAQMQSLMDSLSSEQRKSLEHLLQSAFADQEMQQLLGQLAANIDALDPLSSLRKEYPFAGDEQLDLSEALDLMEQFQKMDRLDAQIRKAQQGGNLGDIDASSLEDVLSEEARQALEQLSRMAEFLEESGYIRKTGSRFELTPKGMRKIGRRALQEIFAYIKKDRIGSHLNHRTGQGIEHADTTKAYEFGDPFLPHLQKTIMNAVMRESTGTPVRIKAEDFEVYQTDQLAQASTVLMLDLSLSMAMRGNFIAAKKVALALDNLIRTQFSRDKLFIVGFSTYAREIKPDKLAYLGWDEFDPYTNIQHGLLVAQKLLGRVKGGTKQIIMISDGEPTAHMEAGQVFLQYPPSPRTIRHTLAEVRRCTQQSIVINTFMLDRNSYLVDFVEQLTRLNRGRVFYTTPERLGQYILVDYLNDRKKKMVV